ncbi:TPA: ead/Ea22-like family protein [Klebsiella pneumoniae]|nr:ead/Ea22-like family protein [Klebsiella pneumoniae]HDG5073885.1 ead/Ea22-like family protein [Klebsiella pneumoniae]HDG5296142.1 ead/Ea22-like family protein [Klebsiella pneumoniae]
MTDITELALLVSKAKASVFTLEYISQFEPADIDSDDVDLRFEVDGRDTGTNVSIVDECGQAAKVIGTLVEALEKAQAGEKQWRELVDAFCSDEADWHKLTNSNNELIALLSQVLCKQADCIAELESRTVTVKLTDINDYLAEVHDKTLNRAFRLLAEGVRAGDVAAMRAAGIKVEAE